MSFDWREYLKVAVSLRDFGDEASIRSGVSRTYYSVYGHCYAYAKNTNFVTSAEFAEYGSKMHSYLPLKFKRSGDQLLFEIGADLDKLRARRNDADYKALCRDFINVRILNESISSAEIILKKLKEYATQP